MTAESRRLLAALVALAGLLLVVGLAAGLATPVRAAASSNPLLLHVPGDPAGWTAAPSRPVFNFSRMAPGGSVSGEVDVQNTSTQVASLQLAALGVHSDKNCVAGGPTGVGPCGAGNGSLDRLLVFTVRLTSTSTPLWTGSILDLEKGVPITSRMAGPSALALVMETSLPSNVGNVAEEDTLSFGLRLTLTEAGGTTGTGVLGVTAPPVPFTGALLLPSLLLAIGVAAAGALLVLFAAERRERHGIAHS
jgi:hypothetical protein